MTSLKVILNNERRKYESVFKSYWESFYQEGCVQCVQCVQCVNCGVDAGMHYASIYNCFKNSDFCFKPNLELYENNS